MITAATTGYAVGSPASPPKPFPVAPVRFKREIFSVSIALQDATNRSATAWNASGLPAGLSIHSVTGQITGARVGLVGTCAFAITARRGVIPPGLNWSGGPEGLRFWGTPIAAGLHEAEFEGPSPENYRSDLTQGGAWDDPALLGGGHGGVLVVGEVLCNLRVLRGRGVDAHFWEVYGQFGEGLPALTGEIATSARYGIFNLRTPEIPPGITVARLIATATKG